jgi:hypothetical protein
MNPILIFTLLVLVSLSGIPARGANRDWHDAGGYRWAELNLPTRGQTGFTPLSFAQTGINFTNTLSEYSIATNRVLANGSGVAVGDYDNDGLPDIFFCGLESSSVLYRNLGDWKFKDATAESGLPIGQKHGRGAVFADLNGDGSPDLLVSTVSEGVRCFLNNGRGKFADATISAGTRSSNGSSTLALADVDGNGTLDLYVSNYRPNDIRDRGRLALPAVNGKPVIPPQDRNRLVFKNGQVLEYGQPDQLFLNDGTGRFREISWLDGTFLDEAGQKLTEPPLDWGLCATFRDVNGDGAPDLYVCNDYWTPDRFWINDGHGHFRPIDPLAVRKTSSSSMGVDFADLDRDGNLDFFVVDMLSRDFRLRKRQSFAEKPVAPVIGSIADRPQVMRNTLFRSRGDGTYAELADFAQLVASDWSWSPIFMDIDLDGYEDLLISPGHFRDVQDLDAGREIQSRQHSWSGFKDEAARQKAFSQELMEHYRLYPALNMPIRAFRNSGAWIFEETTERWGVNQPAVHHGMALGDFDQDGDLDFVVNNLNGSAGVYRNEAVAGRVAVRLKGSPPNSEGIGARITLLNGAVPIQRTEIISGGRYLSGSEACSVFATGSVKEGMTVEVRWRDGRTSTITGVQPNRVYEIDEKTSSLIAAPQPSTLNLQPFFKDVSEAISHTHAEPGYNDFERQPLLPFKLSQPGPGVAWFDLDGDGHDELIIGSGNGGVPAVYRSDGRGGLIRIETASSPAIPSDLSGLSGWSDPSGGRVLFAGITGYESPSKHAATQFRLKEGRLVRGEPVALEIASGSALALGDVNGSGQLVLFIAGGVSPGRYPLGAPSRIYRSIGQEWQLDARNSVLLDNLGIVNGAVWSDLTGDGLPELILACEWGPIRIFQSRGGLLFDATSEFGLAKFKGWWKGVTTGDFDGDGRMDVIAANWGLNSPYHASESKPLIFIHGQLAQPNVMEILETEYDPATGALAPSRQFLALANSLPFLYEQFGSHKAYSEATLDQVLGQRTVLGRRVEATTLASMLFLNRGNRFEAVPLPLEGQLAPAFSVNVADFDGDGHEDVFLSQNFFAQQPETPRLDAGQGLWLQGNGTGQLLSVPASRSGVKVYGEQRGAALGDFNEDGRVDLAVTQNGAATRLYQNTGGAAGLRVRLQGPPGNPFGVGADLRLQFGDRQGPAREIHAGSGYWSQDSLTQVLAAPTEPNAIWIRWPGGRITTTSIPSEAKEITVDVEGKLVSPR